MSEHASSRGYGLFFRDPGYRGIVVGGMAARIPMAMRALGMVVMVSATTGSYWSAGVAAGLCTSAQALFAPPWARLVRHFGVPAVTVASGVLVAVGSVLVILAAHSAVSILWVYVGAVLLGGVALPVGAVTRGLWTDLLEARDISPAFALEGIQDEVSYVAGPALVVTLDVVLFAGAGIAVAGALHLIGMLTLGRYSARLGRTLRDSESAGQGPRVGAVLRRRHVVPLIVAYLFLGVLFGALDVGLVARAGDEGFQRHTGWLLSMLAVGSVVAGIRYGTMASSADQVRVFVLGSALLALALLPITVLTAPTAIAIYLVIAGLFVAPVLICANELLVALVDATEIVVGLAVLSSSITVGIALGSAVAGGLVDALGTVAALALASAGAAVAAVVMTVVWTRRRHDGSRRLGDQGVRCGRTGQSHSRYW